MRQYAAAHAGLRGRADWTAPISTRSRSRRARKLSPARLCVRRGRRRRRDHARRQHRGVAAAAPAPAHAQRHHGDRHRRRACSARGSRRRSWWRRSGAISCSIPKASAPPRAARRRPARSSCCRPPSTVSIEEVAKEPGDAPRWFQLYLPPDRALDREPDRPRGGGRLQRRRAHRRPAGLWLEPARGARAAGAVARHPQRQPAGRSRSRRTPTSRAGPAPSRGRRPGATSNGWCGARRSTCW